MMSSYALRLEALLTGINAQYKNTQEAPNAEEYDHFREMTPEDLRKAFEPFHQTLLDNIEIRFRLTQKRV